MDPETTVTTQSTNPLAPIGASDLSEPSPDGSWRRKERFRLATAKMLTISAHYLKVVLTPGQIYGLNHATITDRLHGTQIHH